jgi:hypothetical protein
MVIDVLVTPFAVAPVASPLPHGESSVPNFVTVAGAVVDAPVAGLGDALPWLPPHAAATTATARASVA